LEFQQEIIAAIYTSRHFPLSLASNIYLRLAAKFHFHSKTGMDFALLLRHKELLMIDE
jgi:hypothetical protein